MCSKKRIFGKGKTQRKTAQSRLRRDKCLRAFRCATPLIRGVFDRCGEKNLPGEQPGRG